MDNLVAQAKAGNSAAEKQIFERLSVTFVEIAKRRTGDVEAAKDITQEACMTIFQKYRAESYSVSFEAWAYGVLRMKVGNYLQRYPVKHKQLYLNLDAGGIHEHSVDPPDHEFKAKLIDCVRKIAKAHQRYARVVNLSYHGFSPKEICLRLKITSGNMRVILSRGRSILKDCLETGRI